MLERALPFLALGVALVILFLVAYRWLKLIANKQLRIDAKLDLLLKLSGLEFDPFKGLPAPVAEAVKRGDKVQAVKLYREAKGVSLKQAKAVIDEIERLA